MNNTASSTRDTCDAKLMLMKTRKRGSRWGEKAIDNRKVRGRMAPERDADEHVGPPIHVEERGERRKKDNFKHGYIYIYFHGDFIHEKSTINLVWVTMQKLLNSTNRNLGTEEVQ